MGCLDFLPKGSGSKAASSHVKAGARPQQAGVGSCHQRGKENDDEEGCGCRCDHSSADNGSKSSSSIPSNHHDHSINPSCCSFLPDYDLINQRRKDQFNQQQQPPLYSEKSEPYLGRSAMEEEDESQSELMAKASKIVRDKISQIDHEMREISLDMHDHPEIEWQERRAHDLFVTYLSKQKGWKVVPHAGGVETAFSATFTHQVPGRDDFRTIGFQSELDALPGIGHACGHNLIAMSGLTASLALAEVLVRLDVPGRIVLLGTPAEEGGGGKLKLLDAGLYKEMDACLMLHPAPESGTGTMLAVQAVTVTFKGRTAHAGAAPWEGVNALDAAVLAYTNISALRQQIEPTMRVHGIIQGKDWAPNVIPGESTMTYNVRAPTISEVKVLASRVQKCFEAAALATGCEGQYEWDRAYADVRNSPSLSRTYSAYMKKENGIVVEDTPFMASTDFGNVTYALPSMHAEYKIHLDDKKTQGNHTVGFTAAARTEEAHERTMEACIGMILTGFRILEDAKFNESVWKEWKEWRDGADGP